MSEASLKFRSHKSIRGTPLYIVITLQNTPLCEIEIVLEASIWKPLTP